RLLRPRFAGHAPPPRVVVADLHHAPRTDPACRDDNGVTAALQRERAGSQPRDGIKTGGAETDRIVRLHAWARAHARASRRELGERARICGRSDEHESTTRANESLNRATHGLRGGIDRNHGRETIRVERRRAAPRHVRARRDDEARDDAPPTLLERRDDELA